MTDTYVRLSNSLLRTRKPLAATCKLLDIDAAAIDPKLLSVFSCDNCSYWDTVKNMQTEPDGTVYCNACVEIEYMRF